MSGSGRIKICPTPKPSASRRRTNCVHRCLVVRTAIRCCRPAIMISSVEGLMSRFAHRHLQSPPCDPQWPHNGTRSPVAKIIPIISEEIAAAIRIHAVGLAIAVVVLNRWQDLVVGIPENRRHHSPTMTAPNHRLVSCNRCLLCRKITVKVFIEKPTADGSPSLPPLPQSSS